LFGGCAGDSALQKELSSLRVEVRALRATNERMEQRVSRCEDRQAVARAAPEAEAPAQEMPELTVVKMKPRANDAPPIDTSTEIQEPIAEELVDLGRRRATARDDDAPEVAETTEPEIVEAQFQAALAGLKTGSFASSVDKLQSFAAAHRRHALSDNALYYSGIGLLALDDAAGAAHAFDRVIAEYPAGDVRLDAMLKLAECRVRLDQKDGARELYARIVSTYPDSPAAAQARQRLSQLSP
jgi:tol-pal system protein YbgF